MSSETPAPSSRQRRVGAILRAETRQRLLAAAGSEFEAHGYAGTTVARIASSAGVTVQTLYLAWGSKRSLLRAYLETALTGGDGSPADVLSRFTGLSAQQLVAELAGVVTEIAARAATGWRIYRDAAAIDAEIATDWDQLQSLRHELIAKIVAGMPADSLRRASASAADTAWVITSPENYELLVERLHYSLDDFRHWVHQTLADALLREPDDVSPLREDEFSRGRDR